MRRYQVLWLFLLLILCSFVEFSNGRGGRRGGKGKGKTALPFGKLNEYSLVSGPPADNRSAHILTGSHFSQTFRLGYKLLLICVANGNPIPSIKWYKDSAEFRPKANAHEYEKRLGNFTIWSKLEIDPATMGDQGIYSCVANNERGTMAKNFKAEYTY